MPMVRRFAVAAVLVLTAVGVVPAGATQAVSPVADFSHADAFVNAAYQDFLGRAPSTQELVAATAAPLTTRDARYGLVSDLARSPEWIGVTVDKMYQDTLGRPADASGKAYWVAQLSSGHLTVANVAASLYASHEYFAGFGHSDMRVWVTDLYTKLLGRESPDALQYWVDQAQARGRWWVAYSFFQSSESCRNRVSTLYGTLLGRVPDSGGLGYWAAQVKIRGDFALAADLAASSEYFTRAWQRFGPHGWSILPPPQAQVPWEPVGIDDSGNIVGNDSTSGSPGVGWRCSDACTTSAELAMPAGQTGVHVTAISDTGTVVGWGRTAQSGSHIPVVWSSPTDPSPDVLQLPSNYQGAQAIQALADGQILGKGTDAVGDVHGLVWASVSASPVVLGVPSGEAFSAIEGVTPDGAIVGSVWRSGHVLARVWSSATDPAPTLLPLPDDVVEIHVLGVTDSGAVYGWSATSSSGTQATVWATPSAPPTVLSTPSGLGSTSVVGITDVGTIIGTGSDAQGKLHGLIWSGASDTTPQVLNVPSGFTLLDVAGVTASGVIYGSGRSSDSVFHGLVWPSPTAGTAAVLATPSSPLSAGISLNLVGMNESGEIIGTSFDRDAGSPGGVVWSSVSDPSPRVLAVPGRLVSTNAIGATSSGAVVGTNFVWIDGSTPPFRPVVPVGYASGQVTGMNESGAIVGDVYNSGTGYGFVVPALWSAPRSTPTVLKACETPSPSCNAWATGVSGAGEIVGIESGGIGSGFRTQTLLLWSSAADQTPATLSPPSGLGQLDDLGISESGVIFGSSRGGFTGAPGAVVWPSSSDAPVRLSDPGYANVKIAGVSPSGQIIGSGVDGTQTVGLVWSSVSASAPTVLSAPSGVSDTAVMAVSPSGEIVGSAAGGTELVVWSSTADTTPEVIALPDGYTDVKVNRVDASGAIFVKARGARYWDALVYWP